MVREMKKKKKSSSWFVVKESLRPNSSARSTDQIVPFLRCVAFVCSVFLVFVVGGLTDLSSSAFRLFVVLRLPKKKGRKTAGALLGGGRGNSNNDSKFESKNRPPN